MTVCFFRDVIGASAISGKDVLGSLNDSLRPENGAEKIQFG